MTIKTIEPSERLKSIRNEVLQLLIKRSKEEDIPPQEILAILAYTAGQCILMLDQKEFTSGMAMEIVLRNIQKGNKDGMLRMITMPTAGSA